MRAVIQRTTQSQVTVDGELVGKAGAGLTVLLGVGAEDTAEDARYLADKIVNLRIFEDADGKMNRSLLDTGGEILAISQFTLYGDVRNGRRPSFTAAGPSLAEPLYEVFVQALRAHDVTVGTGRFQTEMQVTLTNNGPVTILLDSGKLF